MDSHRDASTPREIRRSDPEAARLLQEPAKRDPDSAHSSPTQETVGLIDGARTVVLVEGDSDRVAVETLARRLGHDLAGEDVRVVSIGGSKNITTYLEWLGPRGLGLRLAGLCDEAQERDFQRGLERAGFGSDLRRVDFERLGFFVCVADLEDELIRSLGAAAVERVIDAGGELASYRTFQKQPEWRGAATRSSCGGSSARTGGERSDLHRGLSTPSTSIASPARWRASSPTRRLGSRRPHDERRGRPQSRGR